MMASEMDQPEQQWQKKNDYSAEIESCLIFPQPVAFLAKLSRDCKFRVFASGIGFRIHNFLVIRRCNFLHQIVSGTAVRHFATCMTPC